mgnify:CR=1 FL=1
MSDEPAPMPANATVAEVEKILGPLDENRKANAQALLETAWVYLQADVPSLSTRTSLDPALSTLAGYVLRDSVVRVLRNPEGWRQVGLDDFQGTRDTVLSAGLLGFTEEELTRLQPRVSVGGFYSLQMGVPYWGP